MTQRTRGLCPTCGLGKQLVRPIPLTGPRSVADESDLVIGPHLSPSPVFGPIDAQCPGARRAPWKETP